MNGIVRELRDQDVVDIRPINGREALVTLIAGTGTYIALEISKDGIRGIGYAFDEHSRVERAVPGHSDLATALGIIDEISVAMGTSRDRIAGLAVAVQAPIERATGAIATWCNIRMPGWAGIPLRETFAEAVDAPVVVDNDSQLAALAEWTWGTGRGTDHFLYMRSSVGVGGGIIIKGDIYHGGTGMAGDLGHVALEGSGQVCYCGSRGCLTTLVSERAILQAVRSPLSAKHTLAEVVAAAHAGDAACQRVLAEAGNYIGRALANAAKVIAPSVIAIGGELGGGGRYVFDSMLSSIELNNVRAGTRPPQFVPAAIGEDAALLGAIATILAVDGKGMSELEPWMIDD